MAAERYDVGTAYVNIRARFDQAVADAAAGGSLFGQKFGKTAGDTAQKEFDKAFSPGGDKAKSEEEGAKSGDAFATAYRSAVSSALKALPAKIKIDADTDEVDAEIEKVRAELETLGKAKLGVDFDSDGAYAKLLQLQQTLRELALESPSIRADIDIGAASAKLGTLTAAYDAARAEIEKTVTVDIKLNDGAFLAKAKSAAEAAQRALGDLYVSVDLDDEGVAERVAEVKALLESISNYKIGIDGDDDDLLAKVQESQLALTALADEAPTVRLEVDANKARAEMDITKEEAEDLDHKRVTIKVNADTAEADAKLAQANAEANETEGNTERISSGVNGLAAVLIGLGPALIPVAAAAGAAIAGMLAPLVAVIGAVGVLVLAFHGILAAVQAMSTASAKNSATQQAQAQQIAAAQDAVKQAIQGVADAEQALADARRQASQDASDDAKSVANAVEAEKRAEQDAAQANLKALQQIQDAERGVADARRSAARDAVDSAEAVKNAQIGVADAIQQNSQDIQSALDSQTAAQQALTKAEEDARKAEKDLSEARIQSVRDMQSLTNAIIDGRNALSGDKADVQKLTLQYQQELLNPIGTAQSRAAALLALQEAQQKVVEQTQANTNNSQDLTHDKAQGGTDALLNAQQAQVDSVQALANAQQAAAKSNTDLTRVELANAQRLAQAQQQLADAERDQARGRADDARAIQAAERALAQARAAQAQQLIANQRAMEDAEKAEAAARLSQSRDAQRDAEAIQKAEEGVQRAQEAVTKAEAAQGAAAAKAATTVNTALDKLTPAGQQFAKFLYSLRGEFTGLTNAAQNGLLPGVEQGIKNLLPLMPSLVKFVGAIGKALGDIFVQGTKLAGGAGGKGFLSFLTATSPGILEEYAKILSNFARGLIDLLPVLQPFAKLLAGALLALSDQFLKFSQGAGKNQAFGSLIDYMEKSFHSIGKLITDFFAALAHVLPALAPLGDEMIKFIDGMLKALTRVSPDTIRKVTEVLLLFFGAFTVGRPIQSIVRFLSAIGEGLTLLFSVAGLASLALTGLGIALIVAYSKSAIFRNEVNNLVKELEPLSKLLLGDVKKGVDYLGGKTIENAPKVFAALSKAVKVVIDVVKGMVPTFRDAAKIVEFIGSIFVAFYSSIIRDITPAIDRLIAAFSGPKGQRTLEGFRAILVLVVDAFGGLLVGLKFLAPYLGTVVGDAFSALIDIITTVVQIVGDLANLIDDLVHARFGDIGKDLIALFQDILTGVFNVLNDITGKSLTRITKLGGDLIKGLVKGIEGAAAFLWDHVKEFFDSKFMKKIYTFFETLSPSKLFARLGTYLIQGLVNGVVGMADFLWSRVSGFFKSLMTDITNLFGIAAGASLTFVNYGKAFIQGVINGITSMAGDLWNGQYGIKTLFDNTINLLLGFLGIGQPTGVFYTLGQNIMHGIISGLTDAKDLLVSTVEGIGESIYETLAKAINFVITDILNGFIDAFDKVASLLHLPKGLQISPDPIPTIPTSIPGMATGGIYPGYTPGRDIGYIGISGGEAVMRPEWTKVVGPDYVAKANAAAVSGGEAGVAKFMGGFSLGGIIGGLGNEFKKLKNIFDIPEKAAELLLSPVKNEINNKIPAAGLMGDVFKGATSTLLTDVLKSIVGLIGKANTGGNGWDYPLKGAIRINKPFGGPDGHAGVDLFATAGTPVYAAHSGTIDKAEPGGLAGNYMLVKADGTPYWYDMEHLTNWAGHHAGDKVSVGEQIAVSGYTGNVHPAGPGGAHLHFGIAKAETIGSYGNIGNMLDPISFLAGQHARAAGTTGGSSGTDAPGDGSTDINKEKSYAASLLGNYGWGADQMPYLDELWTRESGWKWNAKNGSSGAYGIPQSLPASKMASAGADYMTNPDTQIRWGLQYIHDRPDEKSPAGAWAHELKYNWYDAGGWLKNQSIGVNQSGKPEAVLTNEQSVAYVNLGELAPKLLSELHRIDNNSSVSQIRHGVQTGGDKSLTFNQYNTNQQVTDVPALTRQVTKKTVAALQGAGL